MRRLLPGNQARRGFTLFEFALAAALFAIAVGIAAERLSLYRQHVESVAAEQLIGTLRVALQLRVARLAAAQRKHELLTIADENPIDWLSEKPLNYVGEYFLPRPQNLPSGSWYFDRREKTLVYLLTQRKSFAFRSSILLKFKVTLSRLPTNPAQKAQSAPIENVALLEVFDQHSQRGQ